MVGDMERQAASLAALLGGTAFKTLQRKAAPCESKVWLCCAVAHQRTELGGGSPVFWHGGAHGGLRRKSSAEGLSNV